MNDGNIKIVKLACVSCGAVLDISTGMERLACGFCGTSQTVERSGGAISLKGIEAVLQQVQQGTDKTAAELALARLTGELRDAEAKFKKLTDDKTSRVAEIKNECDKVLKMTSSLKFYILAWIGMSILAGIGGYVLGLAVLLALIVLVVVARQNAAKERDEKLSKEHARFASETKRHNDRVTVLKRQIAEKRRIAES